MAKRASFRHPLEHRISPTEDGAMLDDTLYFNTQTSSPWDGFRHCGYADGIFYNGVTRKEIREKQTDRIGIYAWCKQGIVGRGVLVDFASYAAQHNISFDPLDRSIIPLSTVKAILKESGVSVRKGDILVIRTGFIHAYSNASTEKLEQLVTANPPMYPGVENSVEFAEWLWDSGIAAVCTDSLGFEAMRLIMPSIQPAPQGLFLHPVLLGGFGMPIGELFDLEDLATQCAKAGRSTLFFTSEPLNAIGGVASPPNALAIF